MSKYVVTIEGREFPAGMAIFALLGKDPLVPATINFYAHLAEREATDPGHSDERRKAMREHAASARAMAAEMTSWQIENKKHVKLPD